MAPSRLYQNAIAALGASRAQWEAAAQRIAAVNGPDAANQLGSEILRMIEAEEQLSADPMKAEPALMSQAIAALAASAWPAGAVEFQREYESVTDAFRLSGQRISVSPRTLYRYLNGHGFLERLADALHGTNDILAERLEKLIRQALEQRSHGAWNGVIEFLRAPHVWAILVSQGIPLSERRGLYVTFDLDAPRERSSARWLHAALALWLPLDDCFLELRYPVSDADVLRFPTFADAGWFRHFACAAPAEPCGWTRPHGTVDPRPDRQPEAVHETPTLDRLSSSDHLRAVPP